MNELKAEIEGILRRYRKERQELEDARPSLKRQYAVNWNLAHTERLELVITDLEMALLTVPRTG